MRDLLSWYLAPQVGLLTADRRWYQAGLFLYPIGAILHLALLLSFALLGVPVLVWFNLGSVALYIGCAAAHRGVKRGLQRTAIWLAALEILGHATVATWQIGWTSGAQQASCIVVIFFAAHWLTDAERIGMLIAIIGAFVIARGCGPPPVVLGSSTLFVLFLVAMAATVGVPALIILVLDRTSSRLEAEIAREHARSEALLLNVLPLPIAARLKDNAEAIADSFDCVTVLFCDLVGFTTWSHASPPAEIVRVLDDIFTRFDRLTDRLGLEKIKTIGDAYMVAAGIPLPRQDHAEASAEMALGMIDALGECNREMGLNLRVRIGVASGPVVAGVIGQKRFIYDLWGDSVNTAARMESHGLPGRIQVCERTYELLKHRYSFAERGVIDVKGKGPMRVFLLTGRAEPPSP